MNEFLGKVAVITGAGNGFGIEFAKECANRQMKVVLADICEDDLQQTEGLLKEMGCDVLAVPTDVSIYEQVSQLATKTIEHFGQVDLLFNNAGVVVPGPVWEIPMNDWDWIMSVNVNGIAYGLRAFIPIMLEQGTACHIVNTASIAGLLTTPSMAAYHTSKHATVALSESVNYAMQAKQAQIKLSVFCPGFVQTNLHHSDDYRPERFKINPNEPYYQSKTFYEGLKRAEHVINTGIPIDSIGQSVFTAIEEERFYILTHPKYNPMIGKRVKDMLEGVIPSVSIFSS